jgi:hypothetical protein
MGIDRAAESRSRLTKEPYQFAKSMVGRVGPFGLPRAEGAQAYLEAQVMERLASGNTWWAHPTGVAGVRISPSELLVRLDPHTVMADGARYPMADYALDHLLPYAESGVEVHGALGLRVKALSKFDLLLRSAGTSARVVLRAQGDTNWRRLLAERHRSDASGGSDGLRPLWNEPELTRDERVHMADHDSVCAAERERAWVGSALLRRIGLFEHFSAAYSVKSWVKGVQLVLELVSVYDAAMSHDVLLDALTDPVWGLPLTVYEKHCNCVYAAQPHQWENSCLVCLGHSAQRGSIQIRFRSAEVDDRTEYRTLLTSVKAERRWLDRVLPPDVGQVGVGNRAEPARGNA